MAVISSKQLCKQENLQTFFQKVLKGEEVIRSFKDSEGKQHKHLISSKDRKIYFDDYHSVRFYCHNGYWYLALEVKTLEDRKKIREYMENNKEPEVTDL